MIKHKHIQKLSKAIGDVIRKHEDKTGYSVEELTAVPVGVNRLFEVTTQQQKRKGSVPKMKNKPAPPYKREKTQPPPSPKGKLGALSKCKICEGSKIMETVLGKMKCVCQWDEGLFKEVVFEAKKKESEEARIQIKKDKKIFRGHTAQDAVDAMRTLKALGLISEETHYNLTRDITIKFGLELGELTK